MLSQASLAQSMARCADSMLPSIMNTPHLISGANALLWERTLSWMMAHLRAMSGEFVSTAKRSMPRCVVMSAGNSSAIWRETYNSSSSPAS